MSRKIRTGRAALYFPRTPSDTVTEPGITFSAMQQSGHTSRPVNQFNRHPALMEHEGHLYLKELLSAETAVVERLVSILRGNKKTLCPPQPPAALSDAQKQIYYKAFSSPSLVITGAPGTGKTTVSGAIIAALAQMRVATMVMAPTGKAAVRIREVCDGAVAPTTIHRALKWTVEDETALGAPRHGRDSPWAASVILVDECSMIDLPLMACLLDAVKDTARVIFIGDPQQLSPVGPGQPFLDFIRSGILPVEHLDTIFRNAAGSDIAFACQRVLTGPVYKFYDLIKDSKEVCWHPCHSRQTHDAIAEFMRSAGPEAQVLSALRDTTKELNDRLAPLLNPQSPEISRIPVAFNSVGREGDKVQQIENNYLKQIFNGDQGNITSLAVRDVVVNTVTIGHRTLTFSTWPSANQQERVVNKLIAGVKFDSCHLPYLSVESESELTLAYALTVHRAQGSEWPVVVLDFDRRGISMFSKRLLFTALSRAKSSVHLFGDAETISRALISARDAERASQLSNRLRKAVQHGCGA